MIIRNQYRGCLKENIDTTEFNNAASSAIKSATEAISNNILLSAAMYQYQNMLFLYIEEIHNEPPLEINPTVDIDNPYNPNNILQALAPFMNAWPEENGLSAWAYMYPIYYHSVPTTIEDWTSKRNKDKNRRGRIAFLYPDKVFSYAYYHKALVDEGLISGDDYMFISLHENILFSYFEEPRGNTNIKKLPGAESQILKEWFKVDPESHFDRAKGGGDNFRIIDPVFILP